MIQANELRIGNYILDEDGAPTVVNRLEYEVKDVIIVNGKNSESFHPFILRESLLLSCGFEKDKRRYNDNLVDVTSFYIDRGSLDSSEVIYFMKLTNGIWLCSGNDVNVHPKKTLNSVHQLQNLYFALTGEELEIKL